jgi:hypothetical protein
MKQKLQKQSLNLPQVQPLPLTRSLWGKSSAPLGMDVRTFVRASQEKDCMGTSGELIRLINYVDDIVTTLRRISAFVPAMDTAERKRLAENLRGASSNLNSLLAQLEKGGQ